VSRPGHTAGPLLVVAQALPSQSSGTSIVLRRLLENLRSDEIILLARNPNPHMRLEPRPLHYPTIIIASLPGGIRGERYWRLASLLPGIFAGMRAVRRYRPGAILAVFPDEVALLTGYALHRLTRLPLLAYFCDLYQEDRGWGWEGALARWLQPRVFRSASRILAVNEGMVSYYRERYGLEAVGLPTCINVPIPEMVEMPPPGKPFVVGYSGNINSTRLGPLRSVVEAIGHRSDYALRYFTPQKPAFLKQAGLWTSNSSAELVSDEQELVRRLRLCDVLFLPLTFDVSENSRDQLATCFGIKSYEYFLSQRPVLLQCPGDYFIARFYRQWDCGWVIDQPGPEALMAGLERLRSDAALRRRLTGNALLVARQFQGERIAPILRSVLRDVNPRPGA